MRFSVESPAQRRFKKLQAAKKLLVWQVHFAWLPVRLDGTTVVWLERVARRRAIKDGKVTRLGRFSYYHCPFDYGPITNVLMQPGVGDVFGAGDSQAQASSAAFQGGPIPATGPVGTALHIQRGAYASCPPQGGLNTTTPQPGP